MLLLVLAAGSVPQASPSTILWAGPAILVSALLIAWAAESAQFFIAQGFALAMLAWMQTLPEFAVEAVLAWHRQTPYLLANLTGALRLLTGLGWPMIYFAAATVHRRRTGTALNRITMESDQSVSIVTLLVPLVYFVWIVIKGSLSIVDAVVLTIIYAAYLLILSKLPPEEHEAVDDLERIPRAIVLAPRMRRIAIITALFVAGGFLIYVTAEPFLGSLFALATLAGIPTFVMIQWVAPFVSEFPEGASTFYFARTVTGAPMALMNMVSSNITQWTLLAAMLPIILSISAGTPSDIPFDHQQRVELLMTLGQQLIGMLFLVNMVLTWWEASALFVLWLVQFVLSTIGVSMLVHEIITGIYFAWCAVELVQMATGRRKASAFQDFAGVWRTYVRKTA